MAERFLPALEPRLAGEARKAMTASGMEMQFGVAIEAVERQGDEVVIRWWQGDEAQETRVDKLIVAIGREPRLSGVDLTALGLTSNGRGGIEVDALCRTGQPGLWAIGDVVRGPMLAHKAMAEGIAVADQIAGVPVSRLTSL
jgi:dihydrolipoamide dehydrogenase